jgi:hypothetical protein
MKITVQITAAFEDSLDRLSALMITTGVVVSWRDGTRGQLSLRQQGYVRAKQSFVAVPHMGEERT